MTDLVVAVEHAPDALEPLAAVEGNELQEVKQWRKLGVRWADRFELERHAVQQGGQESRRPVIAVEDGWGQRRQEVQRHQAVQRADEAALDQVGSVRLRHAGIGSGEADETDVIGVDEPTPAWLPLVVAQMLQTSVGLRQQLVVRAVEPAHHHERGREPIERRPQAGKRVARVVGQILEDAQRFGEVVDSLSELNLTLEVVAAGDRRGFV